MNIISNFLCNECGKGFGEEYQMLVHQYHTHDKTPFKCEECGECGVGRQKFYSHRRKHTKQKEKLYKCNFCHFEQLGNLASFKQHTECHMARPEESSYCQPCGKILVGKDNFENHMNVHLPDTTQVFSCTQCDVMFARKDMLVGHENALHADGTVVENFMSQIPNMSSRSILRTLAILKEKVAENEAKESLSNVTAEQRANLKEDLFETEILSSGKAQQIQCYVCHNFMANTSLRRHMKTFHGARGKKWECKDCGKCLQSGSRLSQHQSLHRWNSSPGESFSCTECKFVTSNRNYLTDHIRRAHKETEGSWVCTTDSCTAKPKTFINHRLLERHQTSSHANVACPECEKIFGAKRNMLRHIGVVHKQGQ